MAPRGGGAKSGGALPKLRILCHKTAFFGPKQPRNPVKTAKRRQTVRTPHLRLDCPVTKSPVLLSSSTICPRNGPKMAKNGLNVRHLCQTGPKPRTGRILGYVAQIPIPRAPSHRSLPLFVVSKSQNRPTSHLDPRTSGPLTPIRDRGSIGAYGDLWGLMGTYVDLRGPIGANGDVLTPMGTYGGVWGPIDT